MIVFTSTYRNKPKLQLLQDETQPRFINHDKNQLKWYIKYRLEQGESKIKLEALKLKLAIHKCDNGSRDKKDKECVQFGCHD